MVTVQELHCRYRGGALGIHGFTGGSPGGCGSLGRCRNYLRL